VRNRDKACLFPGCEYRLFAQVHHIEHWTKGGPTDLENLVLLCSFHHKLVHEYGWNLKLGPPGSAEWFKPDGSHYEPLPQKRDQEKPAVERHLALV
ncbi:MAG: HNH endonuclease signature motif containing protein, partial [Gaiellales bacterium]